MIKRILQTLTLLIAIALFTTSCSKDKDDEPADPNGGTTNFLPLISFIDNVGYISQNTLLSYGEYFKIGIIASHNTSSGSNLSELYISRTANNIVSWDTTILYNNATISYEQFFEALQTTAEEAFLFRIIDKDGETSEISLTITTLGDLSPSIDFNQSPGYIYTDVTLQPNENFKVGILAGQNSTSGEILQELYVSRTSNYVIMWDTTIDFNDPTINIDMNFAALSIEAIETILFRVKDADGETAEKSLEITTDQVGGAIFSYTQKTLGSNQSTTGSFFASLDGTVYSLTDAKLNADKVDFLYFYSNLHTATIAAPDDDIAGIVYSDPSSGLQTWSVLNATRFTTTSLTATDFDNILNDLAIIAVAQNAGETKINNLNFGDVIAFMTDSGKMGLIKVTEIVTGSDGTISFDVIVQE